MTHFLDLSVCNYFSFNHQEHLLAVGWLDKDFPYTKGNVDADCFNKLKALLIEPFQPIVYLGFHQCNLCQFDGPKGINNLFIPDEGDILVAPELILHYIAAHHYLPPSRFLCALDKFSAANGMEYKKQLLSNGGRFLLQ